MRLMCCTFLETATDAIRSPNEVSNSRILIIIISNFGQYAGACFIDRQPKCGFMLISSSSSFVRCVVWQNAADVDADVEELHKLGQEPRGNVSHASVVTAEKRDKEDPLAMMSQYDSTFRDTPKDMAEYIFWTQDEKSVTTAIKDFVAQGLVIVLRFHSP